MKKILLALVLAVSVVTIPTGCNVVKAKPTPGVTQFYSQAALLLADFSGILDQANQLFISAHALALVSDADFKSGELVFLNVAKSGQSVTDLVKAGGDEATIKAQLQALVVQVGQMPTAFHITNPASQAQFTALVQSMANILSAVSTLV